MSDMNFTDYTEMNKEPHEQLKHSGERDNIENLFIGGWWCKC